MAEAGSSRMPHSPDEGSISSVIDSFIQSSTYRQHISQIYDAWKKIGYDNERIQALEKSTVESILGPLKENLRYQVNQAEEELIRMHATVQECAERVHLLSEELSLPPFKIDHTLPLIEQTRILTEKADNLRAKRHERMALLFEVIRANQSFCLLLGQHPYNLDPEKVPSDDDLAAFTAVNDKLKREAETRYKRLQEMKAEISGFMDELEKRPLKALEIKLFNGDDKEFILSDQNLKLILELKEELYSEKLELVEECKQLRNKCLALRNYLKMESGRYSDYSLPENKVCPSNRDQLELELMELTQNMEKCILEFRAEIKSLQEKCFVGAEDHLTYDRLASEPMDGDSLGRHEAECGRLRAFYKENLEFLNKIARREDIWKKKIELDQKENDPSRLNNRGAQMLRDQQEKASVEHELKKLDEELHDLASQWLKEKGEIFKVYGKGYIEFLTEQKTALVNLREAEKEERKKTKDAPAGKKERGS